LVYKNCKCNPLSISAFLKTAAYFFAKQMCSMRLLKSLHKRRESLTAIFSYETRLHVEPDGEKQDLVNSFCVLKTDGNTLFHYSKKN
jgi:hypothetical protein